MCALYFLGVFCVCVFCCDSGMSSPPVLFVQLRVRTSSAVSLGAVRLLLAWRSTVGQALVCVFWGICLDHARIEKYGKILKSNKFDSLRA